MAVDFTDNVAKIEFDINQGASKAQITKLANEVDSLSTETIYRTQPNVRAIVDFLARNVAQLGLHCYRLQGENDRVRDRESIIARILDNPSAAQTQYELVHSLAADFFLHGEAWLWLLPAPFHKTGYILRPLAVSSIEKVEGDEFVGDMTLEIAIGDNKTKKISQKDLIHLKAWTPSYTTDAISPLEAIKGIIKEQVSAEAYRIAVWKNAGHMSAYISRPKDAPAWTPETAKKFAEDMQEFKSGGARQGGWAVLEDGMTINSTHMNATEEKYIEVAELSFQTIARIYHVNPAMLGSTNGVTYANMREFRRSLYGETLGPALAHIEQKLNTRLTQMLSSNVDPLEDLYIEFNLKAKLAGSFEEEADVLQKAVGGSYLTPNEARARQNLPAIEGGDELLRPLNVSTAVEASEQPSEGSEEPKSAGSTPVVYKARRKRVNAVPNDSPTALKKIDDTLSRFTRRQKDAVLARINSKAQAEWWDDERWNKELADDLYEVAVSVSRQIGGQVAADLGFTGSYDVDVTLKFLRAVAESRAELINKTTREALIEAIKPESEKAPNEVFDELAGDRGATASQTLYSTLASFASVEAGKHVARKATPDGDAPARATKTWITNSSNSRKSHSSMDGETVGIDDKFSNGANWPGDPVLGADGVANCMCSVEVSVEVD